MVLTFNEKENLPYLINSMRNLRAECLVIDSGSEDQTVAIAEAAGCRVLYNAWVNHATQLNWALDHADVRTPWVMRMDADERFTPELVAELNRLLPELPSAVTGLSVKRQVWFWGRWIRHGGYYPIWLLRGWGNGSARCEQRWMDEHMVVQKGDVRRLQHDIIDENHKGLTFWTDKHNHYADREVRDILSADATGDAADSNELAAQAGRTRWLKGNIYLCSPLFLRAFFYWLYRYLLRLGFFDGISGLVFHFLQGFWYRFLVDAKLWEVRYRDTHDSAVGPSKADR